MTFSSVSEYLSVTLMSGSQLWVEHNGTAGLQKTVIHTKAKRKLNDAEWHQLNITLGAGQVTVAFYHDDCPDETLCSAVISVDGFAVVAYFGSAVDDVDSYEGFVGCFRQCEQQLSVEQQL